MRRGNVAVDGKVRDIDGLEMKGGTNLLRSGAELRTGAWISRGTIISLTPIRLLPTFSYSCAYNPTFLRLYARHLSRLGFSIPYEEQRSEEHTSELQSRPHLVCRLLLEK